MSETRTIVVKGDASIFRVDEHSSPQAKTTRRRAKTVRDGALPTVFVKMGGSADVPASAPASAPVPANTAAATATAPALPLPASRVVLGGKKPKAMKVVLTKKNHGPGATPVPADGPSNKKQRKVTLGIQHLKRRVTKARRLNKITKALSLDQIKKELLAAKIIKEDSKAPEAILRQMYADAKLITTKSL